MNEAWNWSETIRIHVLFPAYTFVGHIAATWEENHNWVTCAMYCSINVAYDVQILFRLLLKG